MAELEQQQQAPDMFMQKRIELLIEVASKKTQSEMQLLRKMVLQLEQELVELRKQIHTPIVQMTPRAEPMQVAPPPQQQLRQQGAVRGETQQLAPRYGKYTSEDVSIEKFFNFSGKKM